MSMASDSVPAARSVEVQVVEDLGLCRRLRLETCRHHIRDYHLFLVGTAQPFNTPYYFMKMAKSLPTSSFFIPEAESFRTNYAPPRLFKKTVGNVNLLMWTKVGSPLRTLGFDGFKNTEANTNVTDEAAGNKTAFFFETCRASTQSSAAKTASSSRRWASSESQIVVSRSRYSVRDDPLRLRLHLTIHRACLNKDNLASLLDDSQWVQMAASVSKHLIDTFIEDVMDDWPPRQSVFHDLGPLDKAVHRVEKRGAHGYRLIASSLINHVKAWPRPRGPFPRRGDPREANDDAAIFGRWNGAPRQVGSKDPARIVAWFLDPFIMQQPTMECVKPSWHGGFAARGSRGNLNRRKQALAHPKDDIDAKFNKKTIAIVEVEIWKQTRMHSTASEKTGHVQRATSTLVTAFANGLHDARVYKDVSEIPRGDGSLLGGERNFVKIPGFDLDNSPRRYDRATVEGRSLVFTSTNGAAALSTLGTSTVALGSFLNLRAVADFVDTDVLLLCSGTHGARSDEDELFAGTLAISLNDRGFEFEDEVTREVADTARLAMAQPHFWWKLMRDSANARGLRDHGLGDDIEFVASVDKYPDVLPIRRPGQDRFYLWGG
ncbi:hypothetical protein CTAYLR_009971 [Chrysophaeum taylorii]|uniref:2-phosphosulfolactate phosphatase n=1 Tax=Chrysophaeum taylorii TaxID=2483200 RepID=A0AAD7U692_9STRA|nr:hypothetical protein CTAYLR_009971 [Chrysophaeum taylorii]